MDLLDFLSALRGLSESDIRHLAHKLQARFVSPADEVEWWRANLAIEHVARSSRARSTAVTAAGHEAAPPWLTPLNGLALRFRIPT